MSKLKIQSHFICITTTYLGCKYIKVVLLTPLSERPLCIQPVNYAGNVTEYWKENIGKLRSLEVLGVIVFSLLQ